MSPRTPGHQRRGFRTSQILHFMGGGVELLPSYHWKEGGIEGGIMARSDVYLKIQLDHLDEEKPQRLALEICRQVKKIYGVRSAEVSNIVSPSE